MRGDIKALFEEQGRKKSNLVSIVLPVYNESQSLPRVIDELLQYLASIKQYRFEITFVDDRSKDNSFRIIREYASRTPDNVKVSVIRLAKNSGSHVAITAGLNVARGYFVVIMASDGQDPPTVISELLQEWEKGNDLVLASRSDNLDHGAISGFFSRNAWKLMNWSTDVNMPENGCDLLGMDKKVLDAFNKMDERNTTFIFRILSLGFQQKQITYVKRARVAGKSNWTFFGKLRIMADAMSGFTSKPLRMITQLGFFVFIILLFRWAYIVYRIYFRHENPDELTIILNTIFTSLAILVLLLGFIGNYIWRILDETRKRPLYEINEVDGEIFND